ncbi:unnamed protein product [Toxocara canis]|uniref:Frizzled domain-containing protein n=1 Tax=Toxocara canis TaxID=6265 RepID=A0A183U1X5_TOXCA|nr:unnamed protein product [Toxocara canis]
MEQYDLCGAIIRRASGALQWCNIESWLLHTSLLSAFLWLCCFLVLRVGHAPIRKDHCIYVDGRPEMSIRCVLLVIYLVAAIVATIGLWMNTAESDGIMGVCYVGLRSLSNASIFIYVPILISVIGALLMAACLFIRRRYLALLELDAEEENARRQEETVKPVDNERFSDTTHSRLGSTSAAESQPFMNSDDSSVPNVSVEEGNAIIKEREPISNDKDNPKVEEGITTEAGESRPPRRIYRRKKDGCGYTAISRPWLYALLLSIFISILASWVTHLNIGVEPNWERRLVLNSISCSLNETIRKGNDVWVNASHHSDHIISTADPLFRRRTIGVRFEFNLSFIFKEALVKM